MTAIQQHKPVSSKFDTFQKVLALLAAVVGIPLSLSVGFLPCGYPPTILMVHGILFVVIVAAFAIIAVSEAAFRDREYP